MDYWPALVCPNDKEQSNKLKRSQLRNIGFDGLIPYGIQLLKEIQSVFSEALESPW